MKRALITGITGQDGSYLAELLLQKGYAVTGLARRSSTTGTRRIQHLKDRITLEDADLLDTGSMVRLLQRAKPHEIYNLGAQSFVPTSFDAPILTSEITALGVTRILEAIRIAAPEARFYQASSSEMFGRVRATPQNELTPFHPRSPYAVSKVYGHYITVNYRESYNLFACSGILFNHEGPRRGIEFVTRKISRHVALIKHGLCQKLTLGNLDARRDWGYAKDYVRAMWTMLQLEQPQDFVVATGQTHSVRDFCQIAFARAGLHWQDFVETNTRFERPAEVDLLCGDASLAQQQLQWQPELDFQGLVHLMVDHDLERVAKHKHAQLDVHDANFWYGQLDGVSSCDS